MTHRIRIVWLTARVITGALVLAGSVGCNKTNVGELDPSRTIDMAIAESRAFADDVVARLNTELGFKPWAPKDNSVLRSLCGEGDNGITAIPAAYEFDGTYPRDQLDEARSIVIAVGREHGFSAPDFSAHQDDYLKIIAHTDADASYSFTADVKTRLEIHTGCHPRR